MRSQHGHSDISFTAVPQSRFHHFGRYGRLLPGETLAGNPKDLRKAMRFIGKPLGLMDQRAGRKNDRIPAGFTFLGQFIDHDITFDPTSSLERQNDPESLWNFRTPALELDSVYGGGPEVSPHLYDRKTYGKLLLDEGHPHDLPRNSQDIALVADPRNDENQILAQLHAVFIKFHNTVLHEEKNRGGREAFKVAQRLVRWHYQWIIVDEYLPLICGQQMVNDVFFDASKVLYDWKNEPFMPVEFSAGAFRFGHSQVRSMYVLNSNIPLNIFLTRPDRDDLRGRRRIEPEKKIGWRFFFQLDPKRPPRPSRTIDTQLSRPLFHLPTHDDKPQSLATRNLLRGVALGLPSGQSLARAARLEPLGAEHFKPLRNTVLDGTGIDLPLDEETPLWFYILKEAEGVPEGRHLGSLGGRLVAEVLIGLLEGDRMSYLRAAPRWKPEFRKNGSFGMADLIEIALTHST